MRAIVEDTLVTRQRVAERRQVRFSSESLLAAAVLPEQRCGGRGAVAFGASRPSPRRTTMSRVANSTAASARFIFSRCSTVNSSKATAHSAASALPSKHQGNSEKGGAKAHARILPKGPAAKNLQNSELWPTTRRRPKAPTTPTSSASTSSATSQRGSTRNV